MSRSRIGTYIQLALAMSALSLGSNADAHGSLDGTWRSRGYGTILDIKKGMARTYHINAAACLPGEVAAPGTIFRDHQFIGDRLLKTTVADGLTTIYYDRIDRLPALCPIVHDDEPNNDPLYNFDVFWSWFNEQYAFFEHRGVDWNRLRIEYRSKVTPQTSQAELRKIFETMLRQLQDPHVSLSKFGEFHFSPNTTPLFAKWAEEFQNNPPPNTEPDEFAKKKLQEYLHPAWDRYLDQGSLDDSSLDIVTGTALGGRVGYIMIPAEDFGTSEQTRRGTPLDETPLALSNAFLRVSGTRALIIDMRVNFGGDDRIGLILAGLLATESRPGVAKCARNGTGFTPTQRTFIRKHPNAFSGPIVVLTSPNNLSAGESVVMMTKDFPNVLVVGDRTAGVFSDALHKPLPNGWAISLSNEEFVAPDGSVYETRGVPADVLVPYYPEEVKQAGIDPLLEKALHVLGSPRASTLIANAKRGGGRGTAPRCR